MKNIQLYILMIFFSANSFGFTLSKSNFERLNSDFLSFFKLQVTENVKINLIANWDINYPAASTERSTDFEITRHRRPIEWDVSILSGYYRETEGGHDVHLLALCHEMAHHLGGRPYKLDEGGQIRWASMEAQSDYWATKECIPEFLKKFPRYLKLRKKIHPEIKRKCSRAYYSWFSNYKYCLFSSQAALQMAKIHDKHRLPSEPVTPAVSPESPDPTVVTTLDRNVYPSNQCRFDTCIAGALGEPRPVCWYPEKD